MNVLVILQARLSSERYPRKIFHEFWQKKMIEVIIDRQSVKQCNELLKKKGCKCKVSYMVATSNETSDDELEKVLTENKVIFYRGSLRNVLQRFANAVKYYESNFKKRFDIICRVTADNIAPDYRFIADHIIWFINKNLDYGVSSRDFPLGLKCELFRKSLLFISEKNAYSDYEKEHVTPYIIENYKNSSFRSNSIKKGPFLSLTLDTKEDALRIEKIISDNQLNIMAHWENFIENE